MESYSSDWLYVLVIQFLGQAPLFLVYLAGIVFALIRWKRHTKVSIFAIIALTISLLSAIIFTLFNFWMINSVGNYSADTLQNSIKVLGIFGVFANLVSVIFLLLAVFSSRAKAE